MKVTAQGIKRVIGKKSQKTGNPSDFTQLIVQKPIENFANEEVRVIGYVFDTQSVDISEALLANFANMRCPAELELETGSEVSFRGLKAVIVGFKVATELKAA